MTNKSSLPPQGGDNRIGEAGAESLGAGPPMTTAQLAVYRRFYGRSANAAAKGIPPTALKRLLRDQQTVIQNTARDLAITDSGREGESPLDIAPRRSRRLNGDDDASRD